MHVYCISFSVTTFVRLLTNFQKERDMTALNKKWLSGLVAGALMAVSVGTLAAEQKTLHIYNWSDYIAPDTVANFEKETGIKVNYDTYETNEALHAKLVAGNTGYDLVVPGTVFAKPQIEGKLLRALDKSKIPNLANLDPAVMGVLTKADPGNKYLVPWAWGFTTVGINKTKTDKAYYYERYRTQHRAIILLLQLESSFPLFFLPESR